jgi:hypothetical protein
MKAGLFRDFKRALKVWEKVLERVEFVLIAL